MEDCPPRKKRPYPPDDESGGRALDRFRQFEQERGYQPPTEADEDESDEPADDKQSTDACEGEEECRKDPDSGND